MSGILQRLLDVLKLELRVGALLEDLRGFHGMIGNVVARLDQSLDHTGDDRRIRLDIVAARLQAGEQRTLSSGTSRKSTSTCPTPSRFVV